MVWFYPRRAWELRWIRDSLDILQLSIPLWSDFIDKIKIPQPTIIICFQSHYGLILSVSKAQLGQRNPETFNPTMVWFYQIVRGYKKGGEKLLSIPLWSDFIMRTLKAAKESRLMLSIPLWSDFIHLLMFLLFFLLFSFNPTMVWFYRAERAKTAERRARLSIPLWSDFIVLGANEQNFWQLRLSIPLWSDFIQHAYGELYR